MKAFKTLLKTEIRLSLRGMDMFIFAICMPVVVVIILGAVFRRGRIYLFGTVFRCSINHCHLCRRCDGTSFSRI